jgi:hypothetical protein
VTIPIYPVSNAGASPGLGYGVKWSPVFFNQSYKAVSGASIDIGLAAFPLHNFELVYNFLRAKQPTFGELQELMGFYAAMGGQLGRFFFDWPDDDTVVGQFLGTGDGVNNTFVLGRSLGAGGGGLLGPVEPIGMIDLGSTINVYRDGVAVAPAGYNLNVAVPGNVTLGFIAGAPNPGVVVSMDFTFYYYCKFSEDTMTFEKFIDSIYLNNSVKIQSCRSGA